MESTNRNITFSLPKDLLRKVKILAAERDTTISALVRELLERELSPAAGAIAAAKRILELADQGPWFTVDPASIKREELHERR